MKPAEILALDRLIDRIDYYRLLRVDREANGSDVRACYHKMRRDLHPDRFLSESSEVQEAVDRIARRLNEAYVVLRDGTRRTAYDRGLAEGKLRYTEEVADKLRVERAAGGGTTANGKRFFKLMEQEERRGDIQKAIAHLKMAMTFEPQNESFKQKLADLQAQLQQNGPGSNAGSSPYSIG